MAVNLAMDIQICWPPCVFSLPLSTLSFMQGVVVSPLDGGWVTVLVRQGANLSSLWVMVVIRVGRGLGCFTRTRTSAWSESKSEMVTLSITASESRVITRSSVCPALWVIEVTCWLKFRRSGRSKNFLALESAALSTWKLRFPKITRRPGLDILSSRRDRNSSRKAPTSWWWMVYHYDVQQTRIVIELHITVLKSR